MNISPRRRTGSQLDVIEHVDEDDYAFRAPDEFLDRAHPENDQYMQAIERIQRKIMHASRLLRTKQVNIIKDVFTGKNFTEVAAINSCTPITVSRLVHSTAGQRLLDLLQYHIKLLEGPNEALRRNMLWRIAAKEELTDPKTSIKAISELNKMHFQSEQLRNPAAGGQQPQQQVTININQQVLPRGALDR